MSDKPFRLSDRRRLFWFVPILLLGAIVVVAGVAYGGEWGTWPGSSYQVLNLEPRPVAIAAQILGEGGEQVYAHETTLFGRQARYFDPEEAGLPTGIRGT